MKEEILNQILQQIFTVVGLSVVTVIAVTIKSLGEIARQFIIKKKESVEFKIFMDKHENEINTAREVWNIVEEKFRVTDNLKEALGSKADEFDKLLRSKIPYLTEDELVFLRQTIAGEFNKDKKAIFEDDFKDQAKELQEKYDSISKENEEMKNRFKQISEAVPSNEKE